MHTAITVLHILVSIFLVIVVLLQVGKGATIGSSFGGTSSQALFGSSGPVTFLNKITIACAVIFMLTSLYLTYLSGGRRVGSVMGSVPSVKEAPEEEKQPQGNQAGPLAGAPSPAVPGKYPATRNPRMS